MSGWLTVDHVAAFASAPVLLIMTSQRQRFVPSFPLFFFSSDTTNAAIVSHGSYIHGKHNDGNARLPIKVSLRFPGSCGRSW